ncbi:cation:proton antiporter [Pyrococcus furiosus DSM 3638]|uniref:Cation:proton antiporter n=3 Tax=Pyrococcus furiosus TaxID=2261 RepID=A0A5C0XP87_PYRFU|nr:monovalent cation/H+ antiporter complex subunit F [Pyrococcus furiosus]AAL81276.1 putative multisubunit Na+/H+ antiporter [Pyrococcus furiosus DSM 3638]AFN03944.1 monovalent cation/H+ antiporter subunit F [Pyrococcus furiosus COM1]QEK78807.1 cation:proton antiporter [Pyrococcus furiosus DSM 3638]
MVKEDVLVAGIWILLATAIIASYRVIFGPSLADRVVGLNTITTKIVGAIAILSVLWREWYLLDIAIVLLMVNSVGGLIIAKYMERRGRK